MIRRLVRLYKFKSIFILRDVSILIITTLQNIIWQHGLAYFIRYHYQKLKSASYVSPLLKSGTPLSSFLGNDFALSARARRCRAIRSMPRLARLSQLHQFLNITILSTRLNFMTPIRDAAIIDWRMARRRSPMVRRLMMTRRCRRLTLLFGDKWAHFRDCLY